MTTGQYILRLIKWRPAEFWKNVGAWGVFHLIPVSYGLLVKAIFDSLSQGAAAGLNAWTLLTVLAVAYGSRQLINIHAFGLFARYYLALQAHLQRNLLNYLMLARGSRVLSESPAEAVSCFRDDVNDLVVYIETWFDLGGFALYGITGIALLFWVDPFITAVVCTPMLVMTLLMRRMSGVIRAYRRRMREATARVSASIGETFGAVQAVKVAGQEDPMTAHFRLLGIERRKRALADVLLTETMHALNNGLVFVGTGLVMALASSKLRSGTFTVGDFALFIQLLPRITNVLTFVGDIVTQHRRVKVATDRMERLLVDAPPGTIVEQQEIRLAGSAPEYTHHAPKGEPLETLEVRGLTYHYPGTQVGITDVSFRVTRGEFVAITGRIGSGKTTLLRVLQGLLPRDSGEIIWNGSTVDDPGTFFTPPYSSYTAQVPRLFSETLRDNVLVGQPADERLAQAMELAAMGPDLAALEHGMDTLVGTRGVKLSGGQLQRAGAARMFARGADMLIFDDLSAALDVATERRLWRNLSRVQKATCLAVSHRHQALHCASQVLVMNGGRIVAQGSLREVLDASSEMRHLWEEEEG